MSEKSYLEIAADITIAVVQTGRPIKDDQYSDFADLYEAIFDGVMKCACKLPQDD